MTNGNHRLIEVKTSIYYTVVAVWVVMEIILVLTGLITMAGGEGYFYLAVAAIWLLLSLKRVDTEEYAGIAFFGKPVWITDSGLKLIPRGLLEITYLPSTVHQRQHPAEPELVFKGPDDQPLPEKTITLPNGERVTLTMVRPIRVTTAGPDPKRKKRSTKTEDGSDAEASDEDRENGLERDILDSRMALEVTFFVRWRILLDRVFDFIINTNGDVEEADKQMRDAGEQQFAEEFANRTPSVIIEDFAKIRDALESAIKKKVVGWGVEIIQVGWTSPDLGLTVSQALRDIPASKAKAIAARVKTRADAYDTARKLEAEGKGLKGQAVELGVTGADVLAARVARDSIGKGDTILGIPGLTQIFGIVRALKDGMQTFEAGKQAEDKGEN